MLFARRSELRGVNMVNQLELSESRRRRVQAPSVGVQMMEQGALFELGAFLAASPMLRLIGRGDQHPVLVMPGFMGADDSTVPLRVYIRSWGYWVHGTRDGHNMGPTPEVLAKVRDRFMALHQRHGRKVSLVGWSAGGLYARYLARQYPDLVRQVITLASPLQLRKGDRSSVSFISDRMEHLFDPEFRAMADYERGPLPVPATSIYSRTDGVVRWQYCLDVADERHENVEVRASHVGFGLNPWALSVVADRLGQAEDDWRPFHPPTWLRSMYPRPANWHPHS